MKALFLYILKRLFMSDENQTPSEETPNGDTSAKEVSEVPENLPPTEEASETQEPEQPSVYMSGHADDEVTPAVPIVETPEQILQRLNNEITMEENKPTPEASPAPTKKKGNPLAERAADDNTMIIVGVVFAVLIIGAFALWNYLQKKKALSAAAPENVAEKQPAKEVPPISNGEYDQSLFN